MGKGKTKVVGDDRTAWKDPAELQAFCELCAAQVIVGRRSTGYLSSKAVDIVIKQLAKSVGKVVTPVQLKNKWDHLKGKWKIWKQLLQQDTGVGYDSTTGKIEATDEWWDRKCEAVPGAKTFREKGLPYVGLLEIMYGGTSATGKHAWAPSQTPNTCTPTETPNAHTEGSGDSEGSKEFTDLQCEAPRDQHPMSVDQSLLSRSSATVDKGKGLARGVQLFRGITKRRPKRNSMLHEMGANLKAVTDVIVESRSTSTHTPPVTSTAVTEVAQVIEAVLSLPGVQACDRLHMFSSLYFMGNQPAMHMFLALSAHKELQLKWLERQYETNPDMH